MCSFCIDLNSTLVQSLLSSGFMKNYYILKEQVKNLIAGLVKISVVIDLNLSLKKTRYQCFYLEENHLYFQL